ncbi:MAG: 4Fe-4S binding protein [bacterium]
MILNIFILIVLAISVSVLVSWLIGKRRRSKMVNMLHAYVYGRWTNKYIHTLIHHVFPRLKPEGKKWLSDRYHGKILTPELAEALITHDHDGHVHDLEQIVPYPHARKLILKGPPDVAVFDCACRHARENPCQPIQVCMVVGKPFVEFILKQHKSARRLTQIEAVDLLKAEYVRGHLHSAWFKDAMGDRFYAICNCCKCCCGGIEAMVKHDAPMMASSGYMAVVDEELCSACETCVEVCPFNAVQVNDTASVIWDACMGCGVCEGQCPSGAMSLQLDEKKGIPLDVRLLG